ncbi:MULTISPECIES: hypothetical protein [Pseudoalteromonas]|uniref:Uncharacterized protein n=1 Tax=Pseudoalteromonas haloplanktis TaxID=228 RepID=A0ABU1BAS6_PSEHA|nr:MULTISPECIES: hypothetical protein [Pseudoalteromonas]MCF6146683.1 hypothetical protein [Pseudoalteromonas mariniglutinosa NCIMB 1770]MDQ9091624.1 hypothetical protein [Pseudoalteromonas haloplanktis]
MSLNPLSASLTIKNHTNNTQEVATDKGYKLTSTERDKLSGRAAQQTAEQDKNNDLPEYIQKMIEQLERLKQQLEQAKEQLSKLQAQQNQDDEAVKAQVEMQVKMVMELQTQMMTLSQSIGEAMKDAGVSDPGVLLSAMA